MNTQNTESTSMSSFFVDEAAEEGIKMPLLSPTGQETDHWLQIRSVDSKSFRKKESRMKREIAIQASRTDLTDDEKEEAYQKIQTELVAELVIAWSFPEECNLENKVTLFTKAPQIFDAVDSVSGKRPLFYAKSGLKSSSSPQESLS